jgi:hypothetical protein
VLPDADARVGGAEVDPDGRALALAGHLARGAPGEGCGGRGCLTATSGGGGG